MNKICENCGKQIPLEAHYCGNCGAKYEEHPLQSQKYCYNCGTKIKAAAVFCHICGKPLNHYIQQSHQEITSVNSPSSAQNLLYKFSRRVKINGIIWLVIACLQLLLGIYINWTFLIIGLINLIISIKDLSYSKNVILHPVGIVSNAKRIVRPIITLLYNLFFGGVIGVAGSIFYLIAIRSLVMENESAFLSLEKKHNEIIDAEERF